MDNDGNGIQGMALALYKKVRTSIGLGKLERVRVGLARESKTHACALGKSAR